MATTRDIREVITKLSSDKVKTRDEGIKLLNTWLEGDRSFGFCKLLAKNSAKVGPDEIPPAETWPFIITLLTKCVSMEISGSKKRAPRLLLAKTLRSAIQCAEDSKFGGKLLLLPVIRPLFSHIWDVTKDVPSFQSEYTSILRLLIVVKEYRYQMRKRVYCSLLIFYMKKVVIAISGAAQFSSKEELFRFILTFYVLLENSPGDFPDDVKGDLITGFVDIFSNVRDEGKISRKLMECINIYLIKDGPNLGCQTFEIHSSVQEFLTRYWLTTHDRGLKMSFINYARIQVKLTKSFLEGGPLIEQLLDIVTKELDQGSFACTSSFWSDASKEEKSIQHNLMELAASVLYWACTEKAKKLQGKRLKVENVAVRVKDGLMKGAYLWNGTIFFLIHNYGVRLRKPLLIDWFEAACQSLQKTLTNTSNLHSCDAILWLLRTLQEFSALLTLPTSTGLSKDLSLSSTEVTLIKNCWNVVWTCLLHGLPIFSNAIPVADVALALLSNMILRNQIGTSTAPQDIWDLMVFKQKPSKFALCLFSCYFSRKSVQGELRDILYVRRNLLKATLELIDFKEAIGFDEHIIKLIPAAILSLCAGCVPSFPISDSRDMSNLFDAYESGDQDIFADIVECSMETLSRLNSVSSVASIMVKKESNHNVRLPRQIREPLIHDTEDYIAGLVSSEGFTSLGLADIINFCSLLCNLIYQSFVTRISGINSSHMSNMFSFVLKSLAHIYSKIEEKHNEIHGSRCVGVGSIFDASGSTLCSLQRLISCALFDLPKKRNDINCEQLQSAIRYLETILAALAKLYATFSNYTSDRNELGSSLSPCQELSPAGCSAQVVDVDLDIDDGYKDADTLPASGSSNFVNSLSPMQWKLKLVSVISLFYAIAPQPTWQTLLEMLNNENDDKVAETIHRSLCKNFVGSAELLSELVRLTINMWEKSVTMKSHCFNILSSIHSLLTTGLSTCRDKIVDDQHHSEKIDSRNNLFSLGGLVNDIAETGVPDWFDRIRLIDCICSFILFDPHIGQAMIERLLAMLQDADYRVRLFLAKKIGILFQTWDGHYVLFHDICSNFGLEMVRTSKEKVIKAKDVLICQSSVLYMETALVTLAHLAFYSEEIENEAVFMICAVFALEPSHREMVYALLDNLSKELHYSSRTKYLNEIIGSILFRWVACEVSLLALVEVKDLFADLLDPKIFMQYCCPWLLPPLILRNDIPNLNLASKVACKPLSLLVKDFFAQIFAVCFAVHCGINSDKEAGEVALQSSILHIGNISEHERDVLIKKNMVSIVSFLLSLSSSCADPALPYFTKDIVVFSVRMVVDGFFEIDDSPKDAVLVDKINIFRPDRVFKFLLEMHNQITTAVHPRHQNNRLTSVESLVQIIGHRATVSSTSNYIFTMLGKLINNKLLQNQCCNILSKLLELFKVNVGKGVSLVLGEQLQFLVSTLVACCISSVDQSANIHPSTEVISLLHQLTVDAGPSLSDYVKELEPFPDISCLESIRLFHEDLCKDYSSRDRFLKFVRRSSSLPHGLLFLSLRTLHEKLREIVLQQARSDLKFEESNCWNCDPEVVNAVWSLVHLCSSDDTDGIGRLLADFISKVGIGDPCRVVFHLPIEANQQAFNGNSQGIGFSSEISVSEDLLVILLRLLKKFLSDDSAKTVEMTSRTLKGILSTERGQSALQHLGSYERSLVEVHSKGARLQVVERLLLDSQQNSYDVISLEDSFLWSTVGKAYESWVCVLVNSLAGFCNDIIIRLCKDIVLLKSEVAELLFANVLMDLAGMNIDFCQQISAKVQEHIFSETNNIARSIQILLNAMNSLRIFYVTEKAKATSSQSKTGKLSSNAKSRGTSEKFKEKPQNRMSLVSSWEKVYWLSIDYLIVAKAAIRCGSYFTAIMYVEHWCEEQFNNLTLGGPDFSHEEQLPQHIELLVASVTQINEPDSIYGIVQSHKLTSQLITYEHEGNWSRALDYYDLLVRYPAINQNSDVSGSSSSAFPRSNQDESKVNNWKYYKGLMRSLQKTGCVHVLDTYCHGLISQINHLHHDSEFTELQYEAAWRAGNWDFSVLNDDNDSLYSGQCNSQFNEELHGCLRAFQEGDASEFNVKLTDSKKELVFSISNASRESTQYIYSSIIKLQILDHLGMAWDLRWKPYQLHKQTFHPGPDDKFSEPIIPRVTQLESLDSDWDFILRQTQLHLSLLEPFIASRRVMLQILGCKESMTKHLLQSASTLRKASRFSLSTAALHELKQLFCHSELQNSQTYVLGRLEEAKVLRAQGQHEMAVSLAKYILLNYQIGDEASNVYRLVGKWLAESRSSNARTILEQYLNRSVELIESNKNKSNVSVYRQCQTYFQLAHYTDGLFKSYEERLASSEWQSALRLRKHKTKELDALMKRLKSSTKGEKIDYSIKIQELQKQLTMDREEAERLQDDRDSFLNLALEGYEHCLSIGGKYDLRVVFRLVSLWFSLYARQNVVKAMHSTVKKVQSYKFIPLVYQIASRLGSAKDVQGSNSFPVTLVSLLRKMAIDHPYHTLFQLLALANGDRIKDKQRSRNSFVVDMDKKLAAENLLNELSTYHGALIQQMKQMVEIYIKLAELETRKEETNKRIPLPREIRTIRRLELVPVVTATIPVDKSCRYEEGSFPHFNGLSDSVMVMNGINAPKVVECYGSDGCKYRQLAKSGNDDLRQDAVMEQFFGLVNTFLQNHRDTWKRKLGIRTYKVVPFTPSAGVLEWVDGTIPLGEYLLGSSRNGGAHGRYGTGDWSFLQCREHMANEKDKRKAYIRVCDKFRPVMHHFFLERFLQPSEWFESRLSYTRSVAVSSMVGYIVGLGDRHSMNILIDQVTAEVIHIDLGVAFEQGLMLKTPERVPFRLTRDIVDGMGVTGVEGVFRRCCEETLSVMRMNKEALLTIIEVFIHDPLYKWALSPLKALQRQKETEEDTDSNLENSEDTYEGNKDAARATLRVKQKLDGYEDGEMRSVQGQVQQLIQDAVDTDRLCQMFPGWGAWL